MSAPTPIALADQSRHQDLFLHELNWNAPDHPPVNFTAEAARSTPRPTSPPTEASECGPAQEYPAPASKPRSTE